jgi:hypothetical protein
MSTQHGRSPSSIQHIDGARSSFPAGGVAGEGGGSSVLTRFLYLALYARLEDTGRMGKRLANGICRSWEEMMGKKRATGISWPHVRAELDVGIIHRGWINKPGSHALVYFPTPCVHSRWTFALQEHTIRRDRPQ